MSDGRLAVVLHTHMPYVEGFGTWPFGEEWLWEAAATVYVPLLDLLDAGAPVTLSVTPVLLDQLEAPGTHERLLAFLEDLRQRTHAQAAEALDDPALVAAVEHGARGYARAARRLRALGPGGLAAGLARHAAWTSAATHAVLPLLATHAGVALQLRAGIAAHRARHGGWDGGLWLPECAHAPWLDPLLARAGVRACVVDVTDAGVDPRRPLRPAAGPLLVPLDRATVELVWGARGYPARGPYRDSHRFTLHRHHAWAVDGTPYDPGRATAQAHADARDFVARTRRRVAGGGLAVVAVDTELLGHFWHEGPAWLAAVVGECAAQGLELAPLDAALRDTPAVPAPRLPVTTWGTPRTLWTWSGPQVADLAFATRAAELRTLAGDPSPSALRELLAAQSSDWAFLATRELAGPYARARAREHLGAVAAPPPRPWNLAPWL